MPVQGRDATQGLQDRDTRIYRQYDGDVFLKYEDLDDSPDTSSIAIRKGRIGLHVKKGTVGIVASDTGSVSIQGKTVLKASGQNIVKGDFTENPQSAKLYTYTETIQLEAEATSAVIEGAAQLGVDLSDMAGDGKFPLMTNIGGYPPHNHTMMFKHVHAVEPAYLWRMPAVDMMNDVKGLLEKFKDLF